MGTSDTNRLWRATVSILGVTLALTVLFLVLADEGVLQTFFLLAFVLLIGGGALTTLTRLVRYVRRGEHIPSILWRDVIARQSLAFPFVAIFAVRAVREAGLETTWITDSWWWIAGTSIPAVVGAAVYLYFELFVIEADYPGLGNGHAPASESTGETDEPALS